MKSDLSGYDVLAYLGMVAAALAVGSVVVILRSPIMLFAHGSRKGWWG